MEQLKLGIVDINGTIHTDKDGISPIIRSGFRHLWDSNITTTVATGRGLRRSGELLGSDWNNIVSSLAPVSVENGGRLATQIGRNLRYHQMGRATTESALDVVSTHLVDVKFVAYYPKQPDLGAVLWTPNSDATAARAEFIKRHGEPGELRNRSLPELARKIAEDQACMLIVNFHIPGMEEAFSEANMVVNGPELNVLEHGVSKGKGVEDIADVTGIPLVDIFVAGNDHNDVSMLMLPVGRKLLVGDTVTESMPDVIRVSSPEALGDYLKNNI